MAGINNSNEPSSAPQADRWYNLTLGSSFKDHNPSRFCTLRYEFKPASIDKNQRGTLHKGKDNKVSVEFQNIQPGKPKMTFEGTSEDYKDNDAILFFDGESFRLERLHRAVKRLRHNRMRGESTGAVAAPAGPSDASPPPVGKGIRHQPLNKETFPAVPVEVERIEIGDLKSSGAKPRQDKTVEYPHPPAAQANSSNPSPDPKNDDEEEHLDIMNDDDDDVNVAADGGKIVVKEDFDINLLPKQNEMDDEIADVDVSASDDEADKGRNAAEELRAQVNAEERGGQTSSSSDSSGSESSGSESGSGSGSGSGSSSSDSESSDAESVSV